MTRASIHIFSSLTACAIICLAGCAVEQDAEPRDGLGTMHLALPGEFPGVTKMMVRVYEGPVSDLKVGLKYELPCIAYTGMDEKGKETAKNAFTLDKLPVREDYSVVIDLFSDEACTKLHTRAYRAGLAVTDKPESDVAKHPYYIQAFAVGGFAGMARPNANLQLEASQRACSTDADCKSVHATATCSSAKTCTIDTLFPLNGGAKRGLPTVVGLSGGEVAISGGMSVDDGKGVWTATNEVVEVFDPTLGIFDHPARHVDNFGQQARVGLAGALPLSGRAFSLVGGVAKVRLELKKGTLTSSVLGDACGGGGDCPASKAVWRIDLASNGASGTTLDTFLSQPSVAQVATKSGPRVLVAGGATLPLPKSGDGRSAEAFLCELGAGKAGCISASSFMKVGRANAATACIVAGEGGCKKLLIIGGRKSASAPLAEIYDAEADTFEAVIVAGKAPSVAHGGALVPNGDNALLWLGASGKALFVDAATAQSPGDLSAMRIEVSEANLAITITISDVDLNGQAAAGADKRAMATGIGLNDGGALLIGGIGSAGVPVANALWIDTEGKVKSSLKLDMARFGAGAARMDVQGPLAGCVLLAGGFTAASDGSLETVSHVEVFCPGSP